MYQKCLQKVQVKVFWTIDFVYFHRIYWVNLFKVDRHVDVMPAGIKFDDLKKK